MGTVAEGNAMGVGMKGFIKSQLSFYALSSRS